MVARLMAFLRTSQTQTSTADCSSPTASSTGSTVPADSGRRGFLTGLGRTALGVGAAVCLPTLIPAPAEAGSLTNPRRVLSFVSPHTRDTLKVTYFADGRYIPAALKDVNTILRDWRTGEVTRMDPKLLDLLFQLRQRLRTDEAYQVISGYRSPKTNAALARASKGVANKSLHMEGKAIDIDLSSRNLARIRQAALELRLGGVGYYPKSSFVHVDTGRVREWNGAAI
ncbi:DUF882 domain-containing protein [Oleisolibacter albus]|uniref:DUF882 domain-containing protein n=1 Tax=Oleisolibacter albus TaxID=2171757 RepID=UPI001EFE12BD|nr:DUF882 domain-containing protein [Oleisolibacter albus]